MLRPFLSWGPEWLSPCLPNFRTGEKANPLPLPSVCISPVGVCDATKIAPNGDACGVTDASVMYCSSVYGHVCFFSISISDGLYLAALASFLMGIFMQASFTAQGCL